MTQRSKLAGCLALAVVLAAACGDETTTTTSPSTVASSSSASSGGAGGSGGGGAGAGGGTLGTCPMAAPATSDSCDSVDLKCSYGAGCCICQNIAPCGLVWGCIDPNANPAGCPAGPPVVGMACSGALDCGYGCNTDPQRFVCENDMWASAPLASCP